MEQKLPTILQARCERILQTPLQVCYIVNKSDYSLIRCTTLEGGYKYVDLLENKEVPAAQIKIEVEDWSSVDTDKLTGSNKEPETLQTNEEKGEYDTDNSPAPKQEQITTKKSVTKKKTTKSKKA